MSDQSVIIRASFGPAPKYSFDGACILLDSGGTEVLRFTREGIATVGGKTVDVDTACLVFRRWLVDASACGGKP